MSGSIFQLKGGATTNRVLSWSKALFLASFENTFPRAPAALGDSIIGLVPF